jgi:hypothetical protein
MRPLTDEEFSNISKETFNKVFTGRDAYSSPFTDRMQIRLLLYYFSPTLHEPWINPLVKTMKTLGEKGFYLSLQGHAHNKIGPLTYNWYVPIDELDECGKKIYPLENRIYSVNGLWGIISSDEGHAVVGGPSILINNILESVNDLDLRVRDFLALWKSYHELNQVDINWIFDVFVHVYGASKTIQILEETNMGFLIR